MKTRIIHTKIWSDAFFAELNPVQKLLFVYYITNDNIGLTGMYEVTDRQVAFDTGLTKSQITEAKELFQRAGKIFFTSNWVFVYNSQRLNGFKGEKLNKAIENEKNLIPHTVYELFDNLSKTLDTPSIPYQEGKDRVSESSDTPINHKPEIINQKDGVVKGKKKETVHDPESEMIYLINIPLTHLDEFVKDFCVSSRQVTEKGRSVYDSLQSRGMTKKYKNYYRLMRNILRKDFGERKPTASAAFVPDLPGEQVSEEVLVNFQKQREKLLGHAAMPV